MTNGNDLVQFEEKNYEELATKFLAKHDQEWQRFVYEEFQNQQGE